MSDLRSDALSDSAAPKKRNRFRIGLLIYISTFLVLTVAGLVLLWYRMDIYERSRPERAMEQLFETADASYWTGLLSGLGMEHTYAASLASEEVGFYRQYARYTEDAPAYSIRFGGTTYLDVTLKPGETLPFGSCEWVLGAFSLRSSGLSVYAPPDAVLTLKGRRVGAEKRAEGDTVPLEVGPFEANLPDRPALVKYELDDAFTVENLVVTDAEGTVLSASGHEGNTWYYPPVTRSFTVTAPSYAAVTLNGVELTEQNAEVQRTPIPDLKEAENFVSGPLPELLTYRVDGLIRQPAAAAERFDGAPMTPVEESGSYCVYSFTQDDAFRESVEARILEVFDAYAAYNTNRNRTLQANYARYSGFLVPNSDAADRAYRAQESVSWAAGRSAAMESASVAEVIRYAEDCFTAKINFTLVTDETQDANSYLFVFVTYNGAWRVVSVLNK